jgi:catechol 2,3-dioxygenase-like lactoylglutathione lyase family enzyme
MKVHKLDHIALVVDDLKRSCEFYDRVLGMKVREERPGKWCLEFGASKISLHDKDHVPPDAAGTAPGTGVFCVLTDSSVTDIVAHLQREGVTILMGPIDRVGGVGPMTSVYFKDPDGNLLEVSKPH